MFSLNKSFKYIIGILSCRSLNLNTLDQRKREKHTFLQPSLNVNELPFWRKNCFAVFLIFQGVKILYGLLLYHLGCRVMLLFSCLFL